MKRLEINPKYKGMTVLTEPPSTFDRKMKGMFVLDDNLSQKEMRYLYDVMGLKTHFVETEETKTKKK